MVGANTLISPTQWIKRNMLGVYSEKLGRPLTDAEVRVQRCVDQLHVPDWFVKYARPIKFLKNHTSIDRRPPIWKTMKGKQNQQQPPQQRSPGKKLPEKTPKPLPRVQTEPKRSFTSTYRFNRKVTRNPNRLSVSLGPTPSDSETELLELTALTKSLRSPLSTSNTFPRMHPSRKIENLNIVFSHEFPPTSAVDNNSNVEESNSSGRTVYTLTKSIELEETEVENSKQRSHTSYLYADVQPSGTKTTLQLFAGIDSTDDEKPDEEEEEEEKETKEEEHRGSLSLERRFFNSSKKSIELERIVRSKRRSTKENSVIRGIINELDRSLAESIRKRQESTSSGENKVKSMVRVIERESSFDSPEDSGSDDSELAKSTSISMPSHEEISDPDEAPATPPPTFHELERNTEEEPTSTEPTTEEDSDEDRVYWIPSKMVELPRSSSRLSMLSRGSSRSGIQANSAGRCSPGLSPIKSDRSRDEWNRGQSKLASRQLFRIDETTTVVASGGIVTDSGCCSGTSSRAANYELADGASYSLTSTPTLKNYALNNEDRVADGSIVEFFTPFEHKSIPV